jgi:hypothetical protein
MRPVNACTLAGCKWFFIARRRKRNRLKFKSQMNDSLQANSFKVSERKTSSVGVCTGSPPLMLPVNLGQNGGI